MVMANKQVGAIDARLAPGPQGNYFLGSLPELKRKGPLKLYLEGWQKYGDIVRFRMGPLVQHLIVRPEHVRQVLVSNKENYCKGIGYSKVKLLLGTGLFVSEGTLWRQQRRLMQPPFTAKAVPQFAEAITASTQQLLQRWHHYAEKGESIGLNQEMMRLAMNIIARVMFSIDVDSSAIAVGRAITEALAFISARPTTIFDVPLFIPTTKNRRFKAALRILDQFLTETIEHHRKDQHRDLLSLLLSARDEERGQTMTEEQLRYEIMTIFLAGHETTAQALTWAWYLLSCHPESENRLHTELDTNVSGRDVTVADLPSIPYTRMVMEETMRLYPPVWIFPRDAVADEEIGGYHIPKGSMVLLCQYITHRHPEFWKDPEIFEPMRFQAELSKDRPDQAYYPFGAGTRTCLGNHFAMLESQLVLATIAQHYRLSMLPGQQVQPKVVGTLRPAQEIRMMLHTR
ncbi:MAG: cytochrome P450 [Acidobacteriota bacterium]